MTQIPTLRGPIEPQDLGVTLVHEHIFSDFRPEWKARVRQHALTLLQEAQAQGVNTIVDVGPIGWGGVTPERVEAGIDHYLAIANAVEMNIICSTGYYLEKYMPEPERERPLTDIVERMVASITVGLNGSGVRAGIIKVAGNLPELSPWEVKVFTAAAQAQQRTKTPVATHACAGAANQLIVLTEAGADPNHIYFSHPEAEFGWEGRSLKEEAEYMETICRQGAYLQFNNFQFYFDTPLDDLLYLLHYLCDHGCQERIFLSMDTNWWFHDEETVYFEGEPDHPECHQRTHAYLITYAVPLLLENGFTDDDIRTFLVDNPRRFFDTGRTV